MVTDEGELRQYVVLANDRLRKRLNAIPATGTEMQPHLKQSRDERMQEGFPEGRDVIDGTYDTSWRMLSTDDKMMVEVEKRVWGVSCGVRLLAGARASDSGLESRPQAWGLGH